MREKFQKREIYLRGKAQVDLLLALIPNLPQDIDKPLQILIQEKKDQRTVDMNAKFHAICGDIENSGVLWAGKKRSAMQWKVLLVSGHAIATGDAAEIIPGLENEFINIRESTALMSIKRGSSLIEYATAWCATNLVRLSINTTER